MAAGLGGGIWPSDPRGTGRARGLPARRACPRVDRLVLIDVMTGFWVWSRCSDTPDAAGRLVPAAMPLIIVGLAWLCGPDGGSLGV